MSNQMLIKSFVTKRKFSDLKDVFPRKLSRLSTLCSSSSTIPKSPCPPRDDVAVIAELIEKQHWSNLKLHVKDTNPNELFHQLISSKLDPELCLRYYIWLANNRNISLSLELTFNLLHSLANAKKYSKIRSFLHGFVKKRSDHPIHSIFHAISLCDNVCVNSILADMLVLAYANNSRFASALEAFKRAGYYAFKLSALSCKALMVALLNEKRFADVEFVYKEMVRRRIQPNVFTFNVVINSFCKIGKMEKAKDVMEDMKDGFGLKEEMEREGIVANVETYNCLIGGLCRNGSMEAAKKLFDQLSGKALPDLVTYHILMDGYCSRGETRKAAMLLKEGISKMGLKPRHLTYNILMEGYCKEGNLKGAANVRMQMEKERRLRMNVASYNVLLQGYSQKGKMEDANRLLNEMLEKGLIPNRITYEIVKAEMVDKGFVPDIQGHLFNVSTKS
ncbi:hypothetical protein Bca4012_070158 [Brassica carinata]